MTIESATYIDGLDPVLPRGGDDVRAEGAAHLRLIKAVLRNSFPYLTGIVTATHGELNEVSVAYAPGVTSVLGMLASTGVPEGIWTQPMLRTSGAIERTISLEEYAEALCVASAYSSGVVTLTGLLEGRRLNLLIRNTLGSAYPLYWDTPGWTLTAIPATGPTPTSNANYMEVGTNRYQFICLSGGKLVMFAQNAINLAI